MSQSLARIAAAEGDAAFQALDAALLRQPDRHFAAEGEGTWDARHVYLHLDWWQQWSAAALEASLADGHEVVPYANEREMDEVNARTVADASRLGLEACRDRCLASRVRMRAVYIELSDPDWLRWGQRYGSEFTGRHYRGHLPATGTASG